MLSRKPGLEKNLNYSVQKPFSAHDARWRESQPESLDKGEDELEFSLTVRGCGATISGVRATKNYQYSFK